MPSLRAMNSLARSSGQPEQLEEHGGGQRLGDGLVEVAVPVAGDLAHQLLAPGRGCGPRAGAMRFGAKSGSSSLRKLRCSGGSICSGISGRTWPICTASKPGAEHLGVVEHLAHVVVAADDVDATGAREPVVVPSMCTTGAASRSSLNSGWGWASATRSSTSGSPDVAHDAADGSGADGGLLGRDDGRRFLPRGDAVLRLGGREAVVVDLGPVRVVELVEREARVQGCCRSPGCPTVWFTDSLIMQRRHAWGAGRCAGRSRASGPRARPAGTPSTPCRGGGPRRRRASRR